MPFRLGLFPTSPILSRLPAKTTSRTLQNARFMSSQTQKHTFVVYAPDFDDDGAFERRLKVRADHVTGAKQQEDQGALKLGGAMLTPESITGGEKKMVGSVLIVEGESLEAVRATVENDVYYRTGVWDPSKLVILPIVMALGTTKLV